MTPFIGDLLETLKAEGLTLRLEGDKIMVTGTITPVQAADIRTHREAILHELRRRRAFELATVLDGSGDYTTRMKSWPEYAGLVEQIANHDAIHHFDGGTP